MAALSTVALYASYGLPVLLALLARKKGWPRTGPWTLGRWGPAINVVAVVWIVFMVVLMSLPPNGLAGQTFLASAGCCCSPGSAACGVTSRGRRSRSWGRERPGALRGR